MTNSRRKIVTVEEALAILQQLPPKAKLGFCDNDPATDSDYIYEREIVLIEHRYHKNENISKVWFHPATPRWNQLSVNVLSESDNVVRTEGKDNTK